LTRSADGGRVTLDREVNRLTGRLPTIWSNGSYQRLAVLLRLAHSSSPTLAGVPGSAGRILLAQKPPRIGINTPNGGCWHSGTVSKILKRQMACASVAQERHSCSASAAAAVDAFGATLWGWTTATRQPATASMEDGGYAAES